MTEELLNIILIQINGKAMMYNYDTMSLAIVYVVVKMLEYADKESWFSPAFMDATTGQWYSADDLNKIVNN
jgi:hypothetical protein